MMQVRLLDENDFYVGYGELTEENKDTLKYTLVDMLQGFYKPKLDRNTNTWVEGATQKEIEEIKSQMPKPPKDKMEALEKEVSELKHKDKLLEAQNEALSATTDFHEELITEMAMKVYA